MESLYIVMPAYNEADNIEHVVREWYPIVKNHNVEGRSRLLVFNDGSRDDTSVKGKELMQELPLFEMIDKTNSGHGPTLIYAYDYAIKAGADFIFQTDSDGQTNPEEFEAFWTMRNQYDGIFGERAVRGDGLSRAFVEKVVCLLLRLYFGIKVPDANAPFRLMKAETVKKYLYKMPSDYNLPNIMLTTYFAHYSEQMAFRVISFKSRRGGENSINIKKIFKIGWKALGDFKALKEGM